MRQNASFRRRQSEIKLRCIAVKCKQVPLSRIESSAAAAAAAASILCSLFPRRSLQGEGLPEFLPRCLSRLPIWQDKENFQRDVCALTPRGRVMVSWVCTSKGCNVPCPTYLKKKLDRSRGREDYKMINNARNFRPLVMPRVELIFETTLLATRGPLTRLNAFVREFFPVGRASEITACVPEWRS